MKNYVSPEWEIVRFSKTNTIATSSGCSCNGCFFVCDDECNTEGCSDVCDDNCQIVG